MINTRCALYTFFLLAPAPLVPLIDTLYGTNSQDDGYDEEENSTHNSSCDGFVFDLTRYNECHFFTRSLASQRVRIDSEIIRLPRI